jgi:hypothetical protein
MKYMLLTYSAEDAWTEDERAKCMADSTELCHELKAKGGQIPDGRSEEIHIRLIENTLECCLNLDDRSLSEQIGDFEVTLHRCSLEPVRISRTERALRMTPSRMPASAPPLPPSAVPSAGDSPRARQ